MYMRSESICVGASAMNIYDRSVRTVLSLLEKSTGHHYYGAELERKTGLSKPTVIRALNALEGARFIDTRKESSSARLYCELTSRALAAIRLTHPSS